MSIFALWSVAALAWSAGEMRALPDDTPVELGRVRFETDFERALARAKAESKPVFLLFQEIPGCATCKGFGTGPLSHPLLVEAIEDEFVPCVVHNNRGGKDREVLERYAEPAWNNPVVRFVDADGKDLLPRADGVWSTGAVAARMADALERAGRAREWVALVARENATGAVSRAAFAMPCFWTGQAQLGALDDVLGVEAGFVGASEVVLVSFRGGAEALARITERAEKLDCALGVWAARGAELDVITPRLGPRARAFEEPSRAPDGDQLFHLARSPLHFLPLTELQCVRVNAVLGGARGDEVVKGLARWLSPRQQALARLIEPALRADEHALDGLARPRTADALAGYERQVRERLAR